MQKNKNNLMQHYVYQAMAPESQEFNQGVEKCRRTITNTLPPWAFQVNHLFPEHIMSNQPQNKQ